MSGLKVFKNVSFIASQDKSLNCFSVNEGRICYVGKYDDYKEQIKEKDRVFDLRGSYISPGFIDAHTHFLQTGLNKNMTPLFHCSCVEDIIDTMLKEKNMNMFWLKGYGFDESNYPGKKRPGKKELNQIDDKRPVVLFRRDYHSCVVNDTALKILEIPHDIDSEYVRDGFFKGMANDWIRQEIFSDISEIERYEAVKVAGNIAFSKGITTVHALEGGSLFKMSDLEFLIQADDLKCPRIVIYPQITDIEWVIEKGITRIGGCLLIDGSFGSRTAALFAPYDDQRDNKGLIYIEEDFLKSFIEKAHVSGLQLSFHAIGDRAINHLLNAYEDVISRYPSKDHRHRIEHCELPLNTDIERIKKLQLCLGVQPAFEYLWGGINKMYHMRLGFERMKMTNPLRVFKEKGIPLAGGSDSDVTPMDPLLGIYSAVNHPNVDFRLSRLDAFKMFTSDAAWSSFMENETGRIEKDMYADFVCLSDNLFDCKVEEIKNIEVEATFISGECVYERSGFMKGSESNGRN